MQISWKIWVQTRCVDPVNIQTNESRAKSVRGSIPEGYKSRWPGPRASSLKVWTGLIWLLRRSICPGEARHKHSGQDEMFISFSKSLLLLKCTKGRFCLFVNVKKMTLFLQEVSILIFIIPMMPSISVPQVFVLSALLYLTTSLPVRYPGSPLHSCCWYFPSCSRECSVTSCFVAPGMKMSWRVPRLGSDTWMHRCLCLRWALQTPCPRPVSGELT